MRLSIFSPICGLLCLMSVGVIAQLAPQSPAAQYEGQKVSAVSLIANPHRDLQPLIPLVSQRQGEPYSQQKIDASRDALQQTGQFEKVQVSVVPDVSGLRVNFLLEPAYYLGVLKFPGADKVFSYARLLQAANLPDEDPYDPSRIPIAENDLREFFHRNGYFQAAVHADSEIDDAHQLVTITFNIEPGSQARISNVQIEGTGDPEQSRLARAVRSLRARFTGGLLKPGRPYTPERITAATNLMKRSLVKQNRLASSVKENPPKYDALTNRVEVSFAVNVGPTVIVRTEGARLSRIPLLSGRRKRRLIPVYSEGSIDKELVEEGQRNLTDFFETKGFFDVKVTTDFQRKPDQILLVYRIDRGRKHRVARILFHGNYEISSNELLAQVTVKTSRIWTHGSLSERLLKQSVSNIEALYRDRGFEKIKVTPHTVDREPKIDVAFEIEEGAQTLVEDVHVSGNQNVPLGQLTAPHGFGLRAGTPFSPRKLAEDRNRISATYLNRGYLNAEVKATVTRAADPDHVKVAYAVDEHQLVRIDQVVYLGQEHTRVSLITKTAKIQAESPMQRSEMLEAESRLYDLGIFDWSSVGSSRPIMDQTDETALVKVHEAKRNEITYGIGFEISRRGGNAPSGSVAFPGGGGSIGLNGFQIAPSQATFASPRGTLQFTRHNMRGLGETLSASILASQLDYRFLSAYNQPRFNGSQWTALTSFSLERNSENPLFTAATGDLSFQVERVISKKHNTRVQFRYDFNRTDLSHILVPDLVLPQDQNVRLSTFSASLIHDTRDKPLDAHRGIYGTLDFAVTPTALGSSADFVKLVGQIAQYQTVHKFVFANSIRLGLASPFAGSFVPTSQLFFSGGGTSLRGFPIDGAGPQRLVPFCNVLQGQSGCVNITVPVGGKQLFILNSEVRFPLGITKALGGVIFYDGGNVYSAINLRNFVDNYTNTVGFGLRYSTPIGPVRFDVGRNLNPVPGLNPWQYFVTIGQAF
jgi:outer membrane protein assembly complex protein YaeT